jgi:hypothetical protein
MAQNAILSFIWSDIMNNFALETFLLFGIQPQDFDGQNH